MLDIQGKYKFKQDNTVIYEGHNLITFYGLIYFLNRIVNDNVSVLNQICLGNGEVAPTQTDISLGNEVIRRTCSSNVDIDGRLIRLNASFNAHEIVGITEIGVRNKNYLISHDVFKELTSDMLVNPIGSVEVEYTFQFSTSTIRQGWNVVYGQSIYWIYEPNYVMGVSEEKTGTGYHKVNNKEQVYNNKGSYYYDKILKNLYIHIQGEDVTPNNILIQTK